MEAAGRVRITVRRSSPTSLRKASDARTLRSQTVLLTASRTEEVCVEGALSGDARGCVDFQLCSEVSQQRRLAAAAAAEEEREAAEERFLREAAQPQRVGHRLLEKGSENCNGFFRRYSLSLPL